MILLNYIRSGNVNIIGSRITINGKEIQLPKKLKNSLEKGNINNSYVSNNYVYLNGYEYKNGIFKKANVITRIIRNLF